MPSDAPIPDFEDDPTWLMVVWLALFFVPAIPYFIGCKWNRVFTEVMRRYSGEARQEK